MGMNIAQKRAKKEQRRKQAVAEKRRQELLAGSLSAQVAKAVRSPIFQCLLGQTLFQTGIGTLMVVRRSAEGEFAVAGFLLDVHCLGIKDTFFRVMGRSQLDDRLETAGLAGPLAAVEPAFARKLLRDLVAWARTSGFEPPADTGAIARMLGDDDPNSCPDKFEFGIEGKPYYQPGPSDSPAQIARRVAILRERLGDEGFLFTEVD